MISGLRSNRANSESSNGPGRSLPAPLGMLPASIAASVQVESHVRPSTSQAGAHDHGLSRQNAGVPTRRPAYAGDLWPTKWSMKASSCTFSATTRPERTRLCGTWQTSNEPLPSAASMSAMTPLDGHGQRPQRIAAARCASPSWAAAIGREGDTMCRLNASSQILAPSTSFCVTRMVRGQP